MFKDTPLPLWIGAAAAGILVLAVLLSIWITQPPPRLTGTPLPPLTLLPAPTSTPPSPPTPTPNAASLPTPTALPGQIAPGRYVQISGTGGDGLRIRAAAGLDAKPLFLGFDSEIFLVQDGPVVADGYVWWQIASPYETQRNGWAVENYLEVVER